MVFRTCQPNEFYRFYDTRLHTPQGTKEINTLVSMAFWTYMTTLHTPQGTKEINTLVSMVFWTCQLNEFYRLHDNAPYSTSD